MRRISPTSLLHGRLDYRWFFYLAVALFVVGFWPEAARAAYDIEQIKRRAVELIEEQMNTGRIPGLSIALIDDRAIVWAAGFGYANTSKKLRAGADTVYLTGTLTMPVTAAAVMQLTDRGSVELDEPIERYVPDFSMRHRFAQAPTITPRHLLTHHAGLPTMRVRGMWTHKPDPLALLVQQLRDEYLAHPPGEVHSPSHLGYALAGRLIEEVSDRPFDVYMREELLAPLGMRDSSFRADQLDSARRAKGYWRGRTETEILPLRDTPAAGLHSTVNDLARFVQMLFADGQQAGRAIVSRRAVREMLRTQNERVALDFGMRVGLGWKLSGARLKNGVQVVWHNGASPFGRGKILMAPQHKRAVVVLANSSAGEGAIDKISERVLEMLLADVPAAPPAREHVAVPAGAPLAPSDIAGHYASLLGLATVTADDERARGSALGKSFRLYPRGDGLYGLEYRMLGVVPISFDVLKQAKVQPVKVDGRRLMLVRFNDSVIRFAQRFEPAPVPEAWARRLGEYQVTERDPLLDLIELKPLRLVHEDGLLALRYRLPGWFGLVVTVPLRAVSDTELVTEGAGWLAGETIRVVRHGAEERLSYSGYEFRRTTD